MERGLTLVELLVTLVILAVTLTWGLPDWRHFIAGNQASAIQTELYQLLNDARHTAVTYNTFTTLCPSADGLRCGSDWRKDWLLFTDANLNREVDGSDRIIRRWSPPDDLTDLVVRPAGRTYFSWTPQGLTHGNPGSFTWCTRHQRRSVRQLSFTLQARVRASLDVDGDGFHEVPSAPPGCIQ